MTATLIKFPEPIRQVSDLAALLRSIEEPWIGYMHVPALGRHVSTVRLAVGTLSDLLGVSPNKVSTDWLLTRSSNDLQALARKVAPMFRRQFVGGLQLLIEHIGFGVDRRCDCLGERKGSVVSMVPGAFRGKA